MQFPSSFLLINKPTGPTSHDIVDAVRKIATPPHYPPLTRGGIRVGHAGTLDPFASGLLIIGIGREATKQLDRFKALPKTYRATLRLGATSDTLDRTGQITFTNRRDKSRLVPTEVEEALKHFIGEIEQIPPMFSAKKIGGKKLYELARKGETVERKPAKINIYSIKLVKFLTDSRLEIQDSRDKRTESAVDNLQSVIIEVVCSSGTYIRALARDIGEALGCGAYCEELMRTAIGPYRLDDAVDLDQLTSENWQSILTCHSELIEESSAASDARAGSLDPSASPQDDKVRVLVFGTFDRLHPGHLDFFRQARILGDHLTVGIGRDNVVAEIKGRPSRQNESDRLAAVQSCGLVDAALLLPRNPEERFDWIKKISPHIIALGYDQTVFTENLENDLSKHLIDCRVIRLESYFPEKYKSSKTL